MNPSLNLITEEKDSNKKRSSKVDAVHLVLERNSPVRPDRTHCTSTILRTLALLSRTRTVVQSIASGAAKRRRVVAGEIALAVGSTTDGALGRNLVASRVNLETRVDDAGLAPRELLDGVGQLAAGSGDFEGGRRVGVCGTPAAGDAGVEGDVDGVLFGAGALPEGDADGGLLAVAPGAAGDGVAGVFSTAGGHVPDEEDNVFVVAFVHEFDDVVALATESDWSGLGVFAGEDGCLAEDVGHGRGGTLLMKALMAMVWPGKSSRGAERESDERRTHFRFQELSKRRDLLQVVS